MSGRIDVTVVGGAGAGHAEGFAGERLDVVLDVAFAPGQPAALTLAMPDGPLRVDGRAQGSRRGDDGRFRVTFRLVNLRRDHREALADALGG